MPTLRYSLSLAVAFFAPLALFAAPTWPAPPELVAKLESAPSADAVAATVALADAAFSKQKYAEVVALRRLARWGEFTAAHPLPDDLRAWFLARPELTTEFVSLLSKYDDGKAVARILSELWAADRAGFEKYPALACAIALVYDKPCPRGYPHHQVSEKQLPRRLNPPAEAFAFFKDSADGGRLIQSPAKLGIDELAFVVPVVAPVAELREVQRKRITRNDIPKLYPGIVYDHARLKRGDAGKWAYDSYSLDTIKAKGGICIDQAYYTTTVAQAFGVPAFILTGSGNSGFHAFTGYLERPGKWRTDVGRYANQKYATGTSFNPLTWGELTDYDLAFVESRFHGTPAYAAAEVMVVYAKKALAEGRVDEGWALMLRAKNMEPRCPEIWETMESLAEKRGDAPERMRSLYSEAAKALGKFRELEVFWRTKLAKSLEDSGKLDDALTERIAIIRRNASARPEDAAVLAGTVMSKALEAGDNAKAISIFNRLVSQFEDAGPEFFLKVVYPTVNHLMKADAKRDAGKIVRTVNQRFKGEPDSHLGEMQADLTRCMAAGGMQGSEFMKYVR